MRTNQDRKSPRTRLPPFGWFVLQLSPRSGHLEGNQRCMLFNVSPRTSADVSMLKETVARCIKMHLKAIDTLNLADHRGVITEPIQQAQQPDEGAHL